MIRRDCTSCRARARSVGGEIKQAKTFSERQLIHRFDLAVLRALRCELIRSGRSSRIFLSCYRHLYLTAPQRRSNDQENPLTNSVPNLDEASTLPMRLSLQVFLVVILLLLSTLPPSQPIPTTTLTGTSSYSNSRYRKTYLSTSRVRLGEEYVSSQL